MKRRHFLAMLAGIPALAGAYALTPVQEPLSTLHPAYVSPQERADWKAAMHGLNYGTRPHTFLDARDTHATAMTYHHADWRAAERRVLAYAQGGSRATRV